MKKCLPLIIAPLILATGLSGCAAVGEKEASLSVIYLTAALLSALLLVACCLLVRKDRFWFLLLFSSVLVVNVGYTLLSFSTCLDMALWANRIAYLGSVFLPMSMLMIILKVSGASCKRWLVAALTVLSVLVFLVAASPGILPIYYKEVSFAVVNGVSTLIKVYGPLHPLYLVYLLGYFAAMTAVIVGVWSKKTVENPAHAVILLIAVFVNLGVWFIEQLSSVEFEMLSVSYIISELFLLGAHFMMKENSRLRQLVLEKEKALPTTVEGPENTEELSAEARELFLRGLSSLTPTERNIYNAYLEGKTTRDIMEELNIKENTLKFHNKNLYGKLGVSSRKQLLSLSRSVREEKNDR